jgi:hypothetical protein
MTAFKTDENLQKEATRGFFGLASSREVEDKHGLPRRCGPCLTR